MNFIEKFFPEFSEKFKEIDLMYEKQRFVDEKTYQYLCLAIAIKGRSAPCVRKHFKGAVLAGAKLEEIAYIFALVERESAGNDDCWINDVLGDYDALLRSEVKCCG
ncbi:MAG: carboxymuconolactone decarboxylase family protein [Bacteroidetes bacterium]|nr:carboxymuconolactone decarboxylase family protein [Bacteroidota bacterium]MBU1720312.1 carboxymuconolactone decarboxylase family protein [Bacteroidota bacterium]